MPKHNFELPRGRIETFTFDSSLLDNVLGDPTERGVQVYLPPGYDVTDLDYPLFLCLAGFTGSPPAHLAWKFFGESVPQRIDRLNAEGRMGGADEKHGGGQSQEFHAVDAAGGDRSRGRDSAIKVKLS